MKRILFTLITMTLIASCNKQKDAVITPQENKSHRVLKPEQVGVIPYSEMMYNECYGDSVLVTGNLPYRLTETYIPDNRYSIDFFVDLNSITGIGQSSGLTYIGKGFIKDHTEASLDSLNHSVEGKQSYRLTLDAGVTAIFLREDFHYISDAKGNQILNTADVSDTCR